MDNLEFLKKSTTLGQSTTEEIGNKKSSELGKDNTEFLNGHTSGILRNEQEVEVETNVKNVLKQKHEDTVTGYPIGVTDNGNTLDETVQKEALGINITIQNQLTDDIKEETESAVLRTNPVIAQNTLLDNINEQEHVFSTMDTQNGIHGRIIDCMVDLESVDVSVQKETLETDINIQENLSEDAIREETESVMPLTNSIIIQNTHTENINEQPQEVLTMEQLQSSLVMENETNHVIDCKVGFDSTLSGTSTSLEKAKRVLKVPESGNTIQNALIGGVKKLDISEKIANGKKESEVIVKNKSQSLKNLLVYSDDEDYDDGENNDVKKIEDKKINVSSSDSESDSDSSDSESDSDSSSDSGSDSDSEILKINEDSGSESDLEASKKNSASSKINKTTKDPYSADLPHVADLSNLEVDYKNEEFSHIGEITGIIDKIVTITTISGTPVYDIGSILFIEDNDSKKPLGEIFDVIGPVASPVYCVGFKSAKEIKDLDIKPKMKVFSAPNSHLSHYVFLKQLLEAKHTDAGLSDEELSSDEYISDSGDERSAQKRKFTMISKNEGNTRGRGRQTMKHHNYRNRQVEPREFSGWHAQNAGGGRTQTSFASNFYGVQTPFNPSVPPPLYQNNSRWSTPPNVYSPPSWNNGGSSNGPRNWTTPPNLSTPPPQWNSNPAFNGAPPNMPPPPQPWNACSRLGFPPSVRPPQRFAGYQQNSLSDPRLSTGNYRGNYPANPYATAPPRWQPRTHPYQPVRHGPSFPNAPPVIGSNQSVNYPGKDVQ